MSSPKNCDFWGSGKSKKYRDEILRLPLRDIFLCELFHAISRLNFEGRRVFALPLLSLIK